VREWERQLVAKGLGLDDVRQLFACFYADDGLLAARDPEHLELAFDILTSLFDRVGLKTNTLKTEAMTFLPGRIRRGLSDEAYLVRMDPEARAAAAARKVRCELCQVELATGSLASHLETQHDVRHCYLGEAAVCPVAPQSYKARYMPATGKWLCPAPSCPQGREGKGCSSEANLWSHFAHRHPTDKVRIGGLCPPKCHLCGLQTRAVGSVWHERSEQCQKLAAQRRRDRLAEKVAVAVQRKFTAYQKDTLRSVEEFKYLGRVIARDDCDTQAIRRNLKRARQVWGRISKVITKEEVQPKVAAFSTRP
jgi:hypothetical protein